MVIIVIVINFTRLINNNFVDLEGRGSPQLYCLFEQRPRSHHKGAVANLDKTWRWSWWRCCVFVGACVRACVMRARAHTHTHTHTQQPVPVDLVCGGVVAANNWWIIIIIRWRIRIRIRIIIIIRAGAGGPELPVDLLRGGVLALLRLHVPSQ